jgi:hypothetical protein
MGSERLRRSQAKEKGRVMQAASRERPDGVGWMSHVSSW